MQITVVAILCHGLTGITAPVCREEIVIKDEMSMQACMNAQPALAQWKASSIYQSDSWWISRIKCVPGDYVVRDRA